MTTHGTEKNRRSSSKDDKRHRRREAKGAPSAASDLIDAASLARPLEVRLPACAANKVVLPPVPVTGQYKAVFEVEFANASPDTRIDLALAMRIDGYAILRNVQEVAADQRRCVRLDMQTEAQKGQVASLSWRPFSREAERLPPWLTITRAEARMTLVEPPQPPADVAAHVPATNHPSPAHVAHNNVAPPTPHGDFCLPSNGVGGFQGANESNNNAERHGVGRHRGRDSRRRDGRRREGDRSESRHRAKRDRRRDGHGRDNDNTFGADDTNMQDEPHRHVRSAHKQDDRSHRQRGHRDSDVDAKHEGKRSHGRSARAADATVNTPRDAVVATALAAVAAARNAIHDNDEYDDESDTFVESVAPPQRVLVPITAAATVGRRVRRY